jgi:hypothetical protein
MNYLDSFFATLSFIYPNDEGLHQVFKTLLDGSPELVRIMNRDDPNTLVNNKHELDMEHSRRNEIAESQARKYGMY